MAYRADVTFPIWKYNGCSRLFTHIFERARTVYKERSNIVHGRKSIGTVEPAILKDAFFFARQSLQHILEDDTLMKLYSDPITSDEKKDTRKAVKAIKEYFRDLDLR